VASAFIIVVHSEFQPNLNEETNALIRVMIYTMNNTAFGGEVPTVPQWTGTPPTMVQVQAILVASFCVSLLSALLAMLGKQWLNRCAPANIRGTIIERSQYRQRKLDGMANWYFDHVMESLPLMLQAALLLLGCALSRYLWEYNTTVASVVIGVTSFGVLFYLFIVIAGTVSVNCPYQTPGADFLRHIPDVLGRIPYLLYRVQRIIQGILRRKSVILLVSSGCFIHFTAIKDSKFFDVIESFGRFYGEFREAPPFSLCAVTELLCGSFFCILMLLYYLAVDTCWVIAWLLVGFIHQVRQVWLGLQAERQTVTSALGLRCISWTLQTSVEGPVRLLALRYLTTILDGSHPTQAAAVWFDALFDCIKITNGRATVVQGLEELVAASSLLFLCKLSNLMVMDPIPKILEDIRQRYIRTIPSKTRFYNPLVPRTLCVIHVILHTNNAWVDWEGYEPSSDEHIKVAHALTNIARFEYQKSGSAKVPRWLLRFALHSLSQDTLPPASVVTDSLSIIAIDLGCDIPDIVAVNLLDQRCVRTK